MKRANFVFRLYVAGRSPHSMRALTNLRELCAQHLHDRFELNVVDVLREPGLALEEGVLVTPTLVKLAPGAVQKVIGDLSEPQTLLSILGIRGPGGTP